MLGEILRWITSLDPMFSFIVFVLGYIWGTSLVDSEESTSARFVVLTGLILMGFAAILSTISWEWSYWAPYTLGAIIVPSLSGKKLIARLAKEYEDPGAHS